MVCRQPEDTRQRPATADLSRKRMRMRRAMGMTTMPLEYGHPARPDARFMDRRQT